MYVIDIEADGLLNELTKIHVLVAKDRTDGSVHIRKGHQEIGSFLRNTLMEAAWAGHNVLGYDLPALQKIFPWFKPTGKITDTLVMSRVIYTNIVESDMQLKAQGLLPGRLVGGHSLESWGYRLGDYKGDFEGPWEVCTPEMVDYCIQDVQVTDKLLTKLLKENYPETCLELEHAVQLVIQRQIRHGVVFDIRKAEELYAELLGRLSGITQELKEAFGSWYERDGKETFTPKSDSKQYGYVAGCPLSKVKLIEFNPGSRAHIFKRLIKLYGWVPTAKTESGQPQVDEKVLSALSFPHVDKLLQYLLLSKRLGQVSEGEAGWLRLVGKDGRLHGNVNTNGAVTGRMTHSSPNLAQVPKVPVGKNKETGLTEVLMGESGGWGYECRELFTVPKGKRLVGCDASGLELRMLAHYMARYDGGAYAAVLLNGDIHSENQRAAGLPTRDNAKTFIYGFLYGSGDEKTGTITGVSAEETARYKRGRRQWDSVEKVLYKKRERLIREGKHADEVTDERVAKCIKGAALKAKFLASLPALQALIDAVKESAEKGYILGLDKRKLHVRSPHAALNTLLQSAGAVLMKRALLILDERLQKGGMVPGKHYEFVLNIHDEFQIEVDEDKADLVSALAVQSIVDAGLYYKLRCPTDGEAKIGSNWAETH